MSSVRAAIAGLRGQRKRRMGKIETKSSVGWWSPSTRDFNRGSGPKPLCTSHETMEMTEREKDNVRREFIAKMQENRGMQPTEACLARRSRYIGRRARPARARHHAASEAQKREDAEALYPQWIAVSRKCRRCFGFLRFNSSASKRQSKL